MDVDEEEVRRLLKSVNTTHDSVQHASKWIIQRKHKVDLITRVWFDLYQTGSDSLKIALVYVMNDVVQKVRHDKERSVQITFHPHVVNAIALASEEVKKPIKRILQVFRERHIYPKHVIDEMSAALTGDTLQTAELDDGSELDLDVYMKKLQSYSDACSAIDRARKILDSIDFEVEPTDYRTKHKAGVIQLEEEVTQMIRKLQQFTNSIESQNKRTQRMKIHTAKAISYYTNQMKDVAVVHEAYDRFARGIQGTILALDNILQTGVLPGQTPPRDAPSPTPNEDPFSDLGDEDDMEIDEDDKISGDKQPKSSLIAPKDYVPSVVFSQTSNAPSSSGYKSFNNDADPRKSRTSATAMSAPAVVLPPMPSLPPGLANILPQYTPTKPSINAKVMPFDPTCPPPGRDVLLNSLVMNPGNNNEPSSLDNEYQPMSKPPPPISIQKNPPSQGGRYFPVTTTFTTSTQLPPPTVVNPVGYGITPSLRPHSPAVGFDKNGGLSANVHNRPQFPPQRRPFVADSAPDHRRRSNDNFHHHQDHWQRGSKKFRR